MAENQFPYQPQGSPPNQPQFSPPVQKGGKKKLFGRIGIVAAAVGVAAGGAFAVSKAIEDKPEGESTPVEAAEVLFEAIDDDDIIGVTDIMLPSEREAFLEPSAALVSELARLDIAGDDTVDDGQFTNLDGIEFEVTEELVFVSEPLGGREDLHSVTITDGEMKVTTDPEKLAGMVGDRFGDIDVSGDEVDVETHDFAKLVADDEPFKFVIAKEGDDYYASAVYTLVELGLEEENQDKDEDDKLVIPSADKALAPQGTDSKEDAVEQIVFAMLEGDLEKAAGTLDPEEFRAMYDYWDLFGPEAAEAYKDELDYAENPFTMESISTDVQERDGRNVAVVNGFKGNITDELSGTDIDFESVDGTLTANGTFDGGSLDMTVSESKLAANIEAEGTKFNVDADVNNEEWTAKGTFSVEGSEVDGSVEGDFDIDIDDLSGSGSMSGTVDGETFDGKAEFGYSNGCLSYEISSTSSNPDLEINEGDENCSGDTESLASAMNLYKEFSAIFDDMEDLGIVVVERDGKWFVSGVPTYMYMGVDVLKAVDEEELDSLENLFEDFMVLADEGSSAAFDSVLGSDDVAVGTTTREFESMEDFTIDSTLNLDAMEDFEDFDFDSPRTTIDLEELRRELELEDDAMEDATTTTVGRMEDGDF